MESIAKEDSGMRLPVELIVEVVEQVAAQAGPERQHDLAQLRLASKLLCQLATSHFYEVIQLSDYSHTLGLVKQIQAQPQLGKTTRAVWWEAPRAELKDHLPVDALTEQPLNLANVDEVAYCLEHSAPDDQSFYPVGVHYALRDVGPWCESLNILRSKSPVERVQGVPTLCVDSAQKQMSAEYQSEEALVAEWMEQNPGVEEALHHPWRLAAEPQRAIWAAHVVLPQERIDDEELWDPPRTITHLTITLYSLPEAVINVDSLVAQLSSLLDPRIMPLLEFLDIRLSNMGKGIECASEDAMDWDDGAAFADHSHRQAILDALLRYFEEVRLFKDVMNDSRTPRNRIYKDVREYTLRQWQERAHGLGYGPWKDPPTEVVRPQVIGNWDEARWRMEDSYDFPPNSDFLCNRPGNGHLLRQQAVRDLRARQVEERKLRKQHAEQARREA